MHLVNLGTALLFLSANGLATVCPARGQGCHVSGKIQIELLRLFAHYRCRRLVGFDRYIFKVDVVIVLVVRIPGHGLHGGRWQDNILKPEVIIGSITSIGFARFSADVFGSRVFWRLSSRWSPLSRTPALQGSLRNVRVLSPQFRSRLYHHLADNVWNRVIPTCGRPSRCTLGCYPRARARRPRAALGWRISLSPHHFGGLSG